MEASYEGYNYGHHVSAHQSLMESLVLYEFGGGHFYSHTYSRLIAVLE